MEYSDVIKQRFSCRSYDTTAQLDDTTLKQIIDAAIQSPSSFNLQHWRFVVVRDADKKNALSAASWNQKHVALCSAVVAVCAQLDPYLDSSSELVRGFYEGNMSLIHDEAIRSGALASMTLMHTAKDLGWDSCPMIGFNPVEVGKLIELPHNWIITMLITLGKGTEKSPERSRLPLTDVLYLESSKNPILK